MLLMQTRMMQQTKGKKRSDESWQESRNEIVQYWQRDAKGAPIWNWGVECAQRTEWIQISDRFLGIDRKVRCADYNNNRSSCDHLVNSCTKFDSWIIMKEGVVFRVWWRDSAFLRVFCCYYCKFPNK